MADTFDPNTTDDPFERRVPELPPEATQREREIAAKYTRISFIIVSDDEEDDAVIPDATIAWLKVEHQSFRTTSQYCDTRKEASWTCWMLAKALVKIIDAEKA